MKAEYAKEYGVDSFEMQKDSIKPGQRVVIVDDIIATGMPEFTEWSNQRTLGLIAFLYAIGGSAAAAGELVRGLGGEILEYIFIIEVDFLNGRDKLDAPVYIILDGVDSAAFRRSGDHTAPQEV